MWLRWGCWIVLLVMYRLFCRWRKWGRSCLHITRISQVRSIFKWSQLMGTSSGSWGWWTMRKGWRTCRKLLLWVEEVNPFLQLLLRLPEWSSKTKMHHTHQSIKEKVVVLHETMQHHSKVNLAMEISMHGSNQHWNNIQVWQQHLNATQQCAWVSPPLVKEMQQKRRTWMIALSRLVSAFVCIPPWRTTDKVCKE